MPYAPGQVVVLKESQKFRETGIAHQAMGAGWPNAREWNEERFGELWNEN